MATAQQIIDDSRTDIAIDPGKEVWSDAQLLRYLNEGISFVYAKNNYKFEWKDGTVTPLVDGTAGYAYAADFRRLLWAKLVDGDATSTENDEYNLTQVTDTLGDFQQGRDMDKQGDTPEYIYEEDGQFKLWPIPNATAAARWTIKYKYSETPDVLTGVDTPAFPSEWHFVLNHYVRYRAFASKPGAANKDFASDALGEWELWSAKAIADMAHREGERMTYVPQALPSKNRK